MAHPATIAAQATGQAVTTSGQAVGNTRHQQVRIALAQDNFAPAPFELVRGVVLFEATVAGQKSWVLLDPGASQTIVDTALAATAGLDVEKTNLTVTTVSGQAASALVDGVQVEIPNQLRLTAKMAGVDLAGISGQLGRKVGLVLGNDYLGNMAYYINTETMRISFRQSGVFRPQVQSVDIPFVDSRWIDAELNGSPVRLRLDLGHNGVVSLSGEAWERIIPQGVEQRRSQSSDGLGNVIPMAYVDSLPLKIGPVTADTPVSTLFQPAGSVGAGGSADAGADGLLGMSFFKNFNAIFDARASKITLIPH